MQKINHDIESNQFMKLYLLCGEEDYLRRQYRDKLKNALVKPEDTMNYHYFEGKNIVPEKIIDLAQTMPFFSERRLIIIENSGFFQSSQDKLAEYLKEVPESACLIFVETQVDKRGKMYKALKDNGYITEFKTQDEAILRKWIVGLADREGRRITKGALELFLERTGTDMENIRSELEKLLCYTYGREDIVEADVDVICTRQVSSRIFQMIDMVSKGQQREALELYYDLLSLKEPPMRILFLIGRQFNLLYQTKLLRAKGYDSRVIAQKAGIQPFVAGKLMAQASRFHKEDLRRAVEDCVLAEEDVKTGKLPDIISVELLIIHYSQTA